MKPIALNQRTLASTALVSRAATGEREAVAGGVARSPASRRTGASPVASMRAAIHSRVPTRSTAGPLTITFGGFTALESVYRKQE